jgi:hypothetical protein
VTIRFRQAQPNEVGPISSNRKLRKVVSCIEGYQHPGLAGTPHPDTEQMLPRRAGRKRHRLRRALPRSV